MQAHAAKSPTRFRSHSRPPQQMLQKSIPSERNVLETYLTVLKLLYCLLIRWLACERYYFVGNACQKIV